MAMVMAVAFCCPKKVGGDRSQRVGPRTRIVDHGGDPFLVGPRMPELDGDVVVVLKSRPSLSNKAAT